MNAAPAVATAHRESHVRRGIGLEWFTVVYNSLEGLVAIVAGVMAGSVALVGFGFDSVLEVTSGVVLLWRLGADRHVGRRDRVEAIALRLVGWCFVLLAVYVAYDAASRLITQEAAHESLVGIALAIASLVVMPVLAAAKRKVAGRIQSAALTADAAQTQLCTYLSAILVVGLGLNAAFGWWWADPLAGLVMVPIIAKEGYDAIKGRTCCASCH